MTSAKAELFTLFMLMLGHFRCSVVNSVIFNSNLSNFEKYPKNPPPQKKNLKFPKIF